MTSSEIVAQDPEVLQIRAQLERARLLAIEAYRTHLQAPRLLRDLCRSTDHALRDLLCIRPLPEHAALAAVGGYGRAELYPYSDVDLVVLLGEPPSPDQEHQIERLVAALWDLGIEPGCSVRTIEQGLLYAREDITIETSLLEIRFVAGARRLVPQFEQALHAQLDPRAFFRGKLAEMQQRHARYQNTPYALEPNCKESPGGLRDLQVILWIARAAGFGKNWSEIARNGMLTAQEARDLRRAQNAFTRLRVELHLLAQRREDRLVFDLQQRLADIYKIEPTAVRRASEILMQRYYWAARLVTQLNTVLVESLRDHLFPVPVDQAVRIDEHFLNLQGRLDIPDEAVFQREPQLLLKAFLVVQQNPAVTGMTARTLRAIWHARTRIDAQFRRDPVNRQTFLSILAQPQGIVHALRRMTMLNILPRYLPVFRRIVGQMQHDLFHAYTVDQHTLLVIRNLRRFTMSEHAQEHPLCSQLIADLDRHWLLYIAALFHDIAKGRGGDHSELGAIEVRRFAQDHGLAHDDTELLVFLVRDHLLMSQVAQRQDLSNPEVIKNFAQRVGSLHRLTALYLLTVADIRATGPKVWNAWKGKLLEDLFFLARATLDTLSDSTSAVLNQRMIQAKELIRDFGLSDVEREAFWRTLDVAYFLRHDATDIAWHTYLLQHQTEPQVPVVRARVVMQGQGIQIVVYTKDRDDLFANICSYLGRRRLNVFDARIHTTRNGYALDSFLVLPADVDSHLQGSLKQIEVGLTDHLLNHHSEVSKQPLGSHSHRPSRLSQAFPIEPEVDLQPDDNGQHWRLAIVATDRPGLLAQLAQVFVLFKVSVISAKVTTLGERVEDVFMIHAPQMVDARLQRQFERALYNSLTMESGHDPQK